MKLTLVVFSFLAIIGVVWAADLEISKGCIPCGTKPTSQQGQTQPAK